MKPLTRIVLFLCFSTTMLSQGMGTIFIVRHAEKQFDADNTPLSSRGQARAECLARTLKDAHITTIIHSQYIRTAQTAAPLMRDSHATELTVPAMNYELIATDAGKAAQSGNVLIVGHSNTIPILLTTIGAATVTIPDTAYDFLFVIEARDPKHAITLHYCTELSREDLPRNTTAK